MVVLFRGPLTKSLVAAMDLIRGSFVVLAVGAMIHTPSGYFSAKAMAMLFVATGALNPVGMSMIAIRYIPAFARRSVPVK